MNPDVITPTLDITPALNITPTLSNFNFLPWREARIKKIKAECYVMGIFAILAILLVLNVTKMNIEHKEQKLNLAFIHVQTNEEKQAKIIEENKLKTEILNHELKLKFSVAAIHQQQIRMALVLQTIALELMENIYFEEIVMRQTKLTMTGFSDNKFEVHDYISHLQKNIVPYRLQGLHFKRKNKAATQEKFTIRWSAMHET